MNVEKQYLTTPPDTTLIWRYQNLSQFLALLNTKSLYFAMKREFSDKWEGKLSAKYIEHLKQSDQVTKMMALGVTREQALTGLKFGYTVSQNLYGISCWHMDEVESVAMWGLYSRGDDGVAIQSTISGLKACLAKEPRDIIIAEVNYTDHAKLPESISPISQLEPLFTKRRSYRHESEVRAVLERIAERTDEEFYGFLAKTTAGEAVTVDLPTLVQKIVVAPGYPAWAIGSLQQAVNAAGLTVQVETSDLLKPPD
jgi:hypothetical protein